MCWASRRLAKSGRNGLDVHARPVLVYRWIVFLLAAGYALYQIVTADYSKPGGPFRFLTIWALLLSFYSASRMLAISEDRITRPHHVTAMCAAVLNVMVVFLYWRLFFQDPALVGGDNIPPLEQYYLHGAGPLLQIIDALFIGRVFHRAWRAAVPLVGLVAVYVAWAELFVQRFNTTPSGPVTSGLPYPFLNAMAFPDRAIFYMSNAGLAIIVLAGLAALGWVVTRLSRPSLVKN